MPWRTSWRFLVSKWNLRCSSFTFVTATARWATQYLRLEWLVRLDDEGTVDHGQLFIIVSHLSIKFIILNIIKQRDPLLERLVEFILWEGLEILLNIEWDATDVWWLAVPIQLASILSNYSDNSVGVWKNWWGEINEAVGIFTRDCLG